ncbi:hypothetical protein EIP86_000114 [Pleurotus ostreatoroseus]|nr:hypothetical protein EIP86_000114 [Pleurotus ostreatoroseus]
MATDMNPTRSARQQSADAADVDQLRRDTLELLRIRRARGLPLGRLNDRVDQFGFVSAARLHRFRTARRAAVEEAVAARLLRLANEDRASSDACDRA